MFIAAEVGIFLSFTLRTDLFSKKYGNLLTWSDIHSVHYVVGTSINKSQLRSCNKVSAAVLQSR